MGAAGAGQSQEFQGMWGVGAEERPRGPAHSVTSACVLIKGCGVSPAVPGCPCGDQKGRLLLPQLTLACFDLFPVSILSFVFYFFFFFF